MKEFLLAPLDRATLLPATLMFIGAIKKGLLPLPTKRSDGFLQLLIVDGRSDTILFSLSEQIQNHHGLDKGNEFIL